MSGAEKRSGARLFALETRGISLLALVAASVVLSACKVAPSVEPDVASKVPLPIPAPTLQLLAAQPIVVADDCEASGSYFVEFTVRTDGRTSNLRIPQGPLCVQQALSAWVSSFRYAPLRAEDAAGIVTGIEWMAVAGRRGG